MDKLPGTQRLRHKARAILQCKEIYKDTWEVWGGKNTHIVTVNQNIYLCNCENFVNTKTLCSHIAKVTMEKGIFPKNRNPSSKYK